MTEQLRKTIFAGCRELGIDDETRRELQRLATGKDSLADMGEADLRLVVDQLKARGWAPHGRGRRRHRMAPRGDLRLIHVLWGALGRAGKLDNPTRAGLNAFVRRRFGPHWGSVPADIDMLRDHDKIDAVIQALRAWCDREGVALDREA